jgi:hypothetical protein
MQICPASIKIPEDDIVKVLDNAPCQKLRVRYVHTSAIRLYLFRDSRCWKSFQAERPAKEQGQRILIRKSCFCFRILISIKPFLAVASFLTWKGDTGQFCRARGCSGGTSDESAQRNSPTRTRNSIRWELLYYQSSIMIMELNVSFSRMSQLRISECRCCSYRRRGVDKEGELKARKS